MKWQRANVMKLLSWWLWLGWPIDFSGREACVLRSSWWWNGCIDSLFYLWNGNLLWAILVFYILSCCWLLISFLLAIDILLIFWYTTTETCDIHWWYIYWWCWKFLMVFSYSAVFLLLMIMHSITVLFWYSMAETSAWLLILKWLANGLWLVINSSA